MTGTTVLTSAVSQVKYKDSIGYQFNFTGTPVGTFAVQASIDYNPGSPQSGGAPNAGNWVTLPAVDVNNNPPVASGSAGTVLVGLTQVEFPWVRVQYTNTSSTGILNIFMSAKSLG